MLKNGEVACGLREEQWGQEGHVPSQFVQGLWAGALGALTARRRRTAGAPQGKDYLL